MGPPPLAEQHDTTIPILLPQSDLGLALEGVRLDVGAVRRVRARLALGLLEAHLDVPPRREEAVDDNEREHRNGVEDVLSRPRQFVSWTVYTSMGQGLSGSTYTHSCTLE